MCVHMCMYVAYVHVHVYVCKCMLVCVCACGAHRPTLDVVPQESATLFFQTRSLSRAWSSAIR